MIYYSAPSSSLKKQTLILSDGSSFSVERRVIFPHRNVKCKDYVSCQVVETTHLIKANLHTENEVTFIVDKKKNKKKRLVSFLHMFSKVQYLKGLMTVITRNVKAVEISRPDADRYNSSFAVKTTTLTELCTARKEECQQILLH